MKDVIADPLILDFYGSSSPYEPPNNPSEGRASKAPSADGESVAGFDAFPSAELSTSMDLDRVA